MIFTNQSTGQVVTNTVSGPVGLTNGWKLISSVIPASRYKISVSNDARYGSHVNTRTESEWFIQRI